MTVNERHRLVRLSAVPRIVEKITGERPNTATVYRWHRRGLKGVRLRTAFAGGQRRSCEAWVRAFFDEVTAAADGRSPASGAPSQSRLAQSTPSSSAQARHDEAERELAASGI